MSGPDLELLAAFRRAIDAKIAKDLQGEASVAAELRTAVLPAIERAVAAARARGMSGRAWLFGSFAWGQPHRGSDIDVLVEDRTHQTLVEELLSQECQREVHVLALDEAPDLLRGRVLEQGKPL